MVPKFFKAGKSFKSLGAYLMHDAGKAESSERVAWTHTLNLANDQPTLAIDEMLWTFRSAEDLKREAGIKAGGRPLANPVKHFSVSWHPSEAPTREHMTATVESFLAKLGWQEHQALIFCHDDKPHAHVHVMLNVVHPETGRVLDAKHERRKAQAWAKDCEREHGLIFCEGRLQPAGQRTKSPHRGLWDKLRRAELQHDKAEIERLAADFDYFMREDKALGDAKEWQALKTYQREQREGFFVAGKQAFRKVRNAVFREVRESFRPEWRSYFEAANGGASTEQLTSLKADILERQNGMLNARRDAACEGLRERRDVEYEALKQEQREQRAELRLGHEQRERNYRILDRLYPAAREVAGKQVDARAMSDARTKRTPERDPAPEPPAVRSFEGRSQVRTGPKVRSPLDIAGGLGLGALGAIAEIGEKLFDGFLGGGEGAPPEKPKPAPADDSEERETNRANAAQARTVQQASEAEALLAYWNQRRERRRARD